MLADQGGLVLADQGGWCLLISAAGDMNFNCTDVGDWISITEIYHCKRR